MYNSPYITCSIGVPLIMLAFIKKNEIYDIYSEKKNKIRASLATATQKCIIIRKEKKCGKQNIKTMRYVTKTLPYRKTRKKNLNTKNFVILTSTETPGRINTCAGGISRGTYL